MALVTTVSRRWVRFNVVGFGGFIVQLACLFVLTRVLSGHYVVATAAAVELAILHNFFWHTRWTWSDRAAAAPQVARRFARFNFLNGLLSIAANTSLTWVLVERGHLPYLLANACAVGVCSLAGFAMSERIVFRTALAAGAACALTGVPVMASEMQPGAAHAFDRYVRFAEARMDRERQGTAPFLWIDRLSDVQRQDLMIQLRSGRVVVERQSPSPGESMEFVGARCHDWVGTAFLPAVHVRDVLALMREYERYPEIYGPAIRRGRTLTHDDTHYRVVLELFQRRVISVVLNTDSDVRYLPSSPTRAQIRSASTRIAEVDRPDTPAERELMAGSGDDHGFLWRFNNYCSLDERDVGTYVQCETITLSRDVPFGLKWLIDPFVSSVPKESLEFTLTAMTRALTPRTRT